MKKSYLFLALVLTIVLAKNCSAATLRDADTDNEGDSGEQTESEFESESDSEDENESNPAMSCLLFGDKGCDVACKVTSQAYGIEGNGHCTENQFCNCIPSGDISFHERWNKLFDADYVYRKITEEQYKENEAQTIFRFPFRSAEEFKQLFKPIVSPYQFSKLKVHDDTMAAKFTNKGEGKADEAAVKKYVSEKVGKLLKSKAYKSLLSTKYKQRFTKFLTESGSRKGTLYNIALRVRQSKNKVLDQLLKEYFKKNEIEDPSLDMFDYDDLPSTLITTVENEIIKLINEKNEAPSAKKKTAPGKRAVKRTATKSKSAAKSD